MEKYNKIRHARTEELDNIMKIYASARIFMAENGNKEQWGDGYPQRELIEEDLKKISCMCMRKKARSEQYLFFSKEPIRIMRCQSAVCGPVQSHMECCTGLQLQDLEKGLPRNVCSGAMHSVIACGEIPDRRIKVCSACLRKMDLPNAPWSIWVPVKCWDMKDMRKGVKQT